MSDIERNRMLIDLPLSVQMAIKLAAVKRCKKMGLIVETAIRQAYPKEMKEAEEIANGKQ